jgi:hypothetical protein
MHFQKEDLEGTHYHWPTGSDKDIYTGQPSRRSFDPFNGEQVLFMINYYAEQVTNFSIQEVKLIERELAFSLPTSLKSEVSVYDWMRNLDLTVKQTEE